MTNDQVTDARFGWPQALLRGLAAGLGLGVLLAFVVVLTGYPGWGQGVWAFSVLLAPLLLTLALLLHGAVRLIWAYANKGRRSGPAPLPDHGYSWIRVVASGGAALAVVALALTMAYRAGGETSPF